MRTNKIGKQKTLGVLRSAISCVPLTSLGTMLLLCGYMSVLALPADVYSHPAYLHICVFSSPDENLVKNLHCCISPNENKKIRGLVFFPNKRTRERYVLNKRKMVGEKKSFSFRIFSVKSAVIRWEQEMENKHAQNRRNTKNKISKISARMHAARQKVLCTMKGKEKVLGVKINPSTTK